MGFMKEFKDFAMRGNVIDLAVGVIIGAAFGKIVNSIVTDIIMPPIGVMIGGVKFSDLKYTIQKAVTDPDTHKITEPAVTVNYGNFIQTVFEFIIIAFSIFIMVKVINRLTHLRRKEEEEKEAAKPAEPTKQEVLLTEIRDLLKNK
jgi:large conductance mechanosensitive channel